LIPDTSDAKAFGLFEQAAAVESFNWDKWVSEVLIQVHFAPMAGGKPNLAVVDHVCRLHALNSEAESGAQYLKISELRLDGFERVLSKQDYMAGDRLTIVDLWYLPCALCILPLRLCLTC
jgi:glutathione S-transferase